MAEKTYTYDIDEMPDGKVCPSRLTTEIGSSAIVTAIERIETSGGSWALGVVTGGTLNITFKAELSQGDKTILDGGQTQTEESPPLEGSLLADHDSSACTISPAIDTDGILMSRSVPQCNEHMMCNRDIRFKTAIVGSSSIEDKKFNTTSKLEEDWNEWSQVGVYKSDGQGGMVAVTDQADADSNATLSIFEYKAVDQTDGTTEIAWQVRGGSMQVDPTIPANERWSHRAYAIAAPAIPSSYGGMIRFFDGFLGPWAGVDELRNESPTVKLMDPAVATGAARLRFYFVYPAGAKYEHLLRWLTYRPLKTF